MKPHGLKGDVTIFLHPDSPADFRGLKTIFIEKNNALIPFFIENVSVRDEKAFIKLEDVSSPDEASRLKNCSIFLPKDSRPKLPAGDFYDDEIAEFEVIDEKEGPIGMAKLVERAGLNRFIIVDYQQKEIMIPVKPPLLKSINRSKKRITVNLPEGFLDI
ncbi:MAG: 16S rRNA processing protein RimM [Cyclobacteriaceae bacterium]|nr:16S rRNA processing protein RimM [Cyclobacteriaceae bacterium]